MTLFHDLMGHRLSLVCEIWSDVVATIDEQRRRGEKTQRPEVLNMYWGLVIANGGDNRVDRWG